MKLAKGPRPLQVHGFSLIFVLVGAFSLLNDLRNIDEVIAVLQFDIPTVDWSRDLAIVFTSAIFTIVLIPVVAIWGFASRIARILVTIMVVPTALQLFAALWIAATRGLFVAGTIIEASLLLFAVMILYTRASSRWLGKSKGVDGASNA